MPFNIDLAMLLYISLAKLPNLSSNYKHPDLVLNTFPSKKAKKTFFSLTQEATFDYTYTTRTHRAKSAGLLGSSLTILLLIIL